MNCICMPWVKLKLIRYVHYPEFQMAQIPHASSDREVFLGGMPHENINHFKGIACCKVGDRSNCFSPVSGMVCGMTIMSLINCQHYPFQRMKASHCQKHMQDDSVHRNIYIPLTETSFSTVTSDFYLCLCTLFSPLSIYLLYHSRGFLYPCLISSTNVLQGQNA